MTVSFDSALQAFVAGAQAIVDDYQADSFPTLESRVLSVQDGRRYVRVVDTQYGSSSVHCFVDKSNGDVLKAAQWRSPAKHARGNIYDEANGLASMGPYGPAYLR
jgi:hypothetical protein